jgi:CDGSH-type Zn-finger protein
MADTPRIEIQANGPYVVHGDVPLNEMAPVHTFNGEPVAWHDLGEVPSDDQPVYLCRCGHSASKPFCDDSHLRVGFDGTETADRGPFADRAEVEEHDGHAFADDGSLCVSAGFCGTRTTSVWNLLEESNDPAALDRMREMIWNCPSGRLALLAANGATTEPDLPQSIAVTPGGPLWVRGGIPVIGADGQSWETRNRVTLCRCGQSSNRPFCDRTHASLHFDER